MTRKKMNLLIYVPISLHKCLIITRLNNEPPHDKTNKVTVRPAKT